LIGPTQRIWRGGRWTPNKSNRQRPAVASIQLLAFMKLETTYTIHLNEKEAKALKTLLGNMSDPEFAKAGIKGEDRATMSEIWQALPDDGDE
jgi:hypothetical protein